MERRAIPAFPTPRPAAKGEQALPRVHRQSFLRDYVVGEIIQSLRARHAK